MAEKGRYITAEHPVVKTLLHCGESVAVFSRIFSGERARLLSRLSGMEEMYGAYDPKTEMTLIIPDDFLKHMRVPSSELPALKVRAGKAMRRVQRAAQPPVVSLVRLYNRVPFSLD